MAEIDTAKQEAFQRWAKTLAKQNKGKLPLVFPGSPEWDAWRAFRVEHRLGVSFMDTCAIYGKPWTVPTRFPPNQEEAAIIFTGDKPLEDAPRLAV